MSVFMTSALFISQDTSWLIGGGLRYGQLLGSDLGWSAFSIDGDGE